MIEKIASRIMFVIWQVFLSTRRSVALVTAPEAARRTAATNRTRSTVVRPHFSPNQSHAFTGFGANSNQRWLLI